MIQAYSKRLLSPFTGQVQVVSTGLARARTLDGLTWEIQFKHTFMEDEANALQLPENAPRHRYVNIAFLKEGEVQRVPVPPYIDRQQTDEQLALLTDYLEKLELPLPPADAHEYWLLDEDEQPLALIFSCVDADEMPAFPQKLQWTATPASIIKVPSLPEEEQHYVPPVNYRLEQLVNERAGKHPQARWIRRRDGLSEDFPPLLVREDWDSEEAQQLCRRYIERLSPRLLMLHGLDNESRLHLEGQAKNYVMEVDRFFYLYPEVVDDKSMSAMRVEARLRKAADPDQY